MSLYHLVLPWLLLWLVWQLGYDRRAWPVWILAGWTLLVVTYLTPDEHNVNFVYGYGADAFLPVLPWVWLLLALAVAATVWSLTHWLILFVWQKFGRPVFP